MRFSLGKYFLRNNLKIYPFVGLQLMTKNRVWAYPNMIEGLGFVSDDLNFRYNNILTSLSLYKDKDGTIWSFINKNDQWHLGRFEPTKDGKVTLEPIKNKNESVDIWSIYKDESTGLIWGGGLNGFFFNYDFKTKQTTILNQFNGIDAFEKATIYHIEPFQEQYFWLATSNGLYLADKKKRYSFKVFR